MISMKDILVNERMLLREISIVRFRFACFSAPAQWFPFEKLNQEGPFVRYLIW